MSMYSTPNPKKRKNQENEKEKTKEERVSQELSSEDDLIDEAIDESFPASDSPGYRSKSHVDQEVHHPD